MRKKMKNVKFIFNTQFRFSKNLNILLRSVNVLRINHMSSGPSSFRSLTAGHAKVT